MEHGDPFGNGWFSFNGAVGGGGIGAERRPAARRRWRVLARDRLGLGRRARLLRRLRSHQPDRPVGHRVLQLLDQPRRRPGLHARDQPPGGRQRRRRATRPTTTSSSSTASSRRPARARSRGGGWQLVSIPLADFFDDNSFFTGGNGVLDPTPAGRGGNGELINVVVAVIGTRLRRQLPHRLLGVHPRAARTGEPPASIIDDFESGVAPGDAVRAERCRRSASAPSTAPAAASRSPTRPRRRRRCFPAVGTPNSVLQMDVDVDVVRRVHPRLLEPAALDTWIPQDWSTSEGISLWLHGTGSGTELFIDILDNRNPGSTTDDAERWTVPFVDDFTGWQLLEFPFASFTRKEIGNGAPNDGLGLFEMHGWALGTLGTGGPRTLLRRRGERSTASPSRPRWRSVLAAEHVHRGGHDRRRRRQAQPADGSGRPGPGQHRLRHRALERDRRRGVHARPAARSRSSTADRPS